MLNSTAFSASLCSSGCSPIFSERCLASPCPMPSTLIHHFRKFSLKNKDELRFHLLHLLLTWLANKASYYCLPNERLLLPRLTHSPNTRVECWDLCRGLPLGGFMVEGVSFSVYCMSLDLRWTVQTNSFWMNLCLFSWNSKRFNNVPHKRTAVLTLLLLLACEATKDPLVTTL